MKQAKSLENQRAGSWTQKIIPLLVLACSLSVFDPCSSVAHAFTTFPPRLSVPHDAFDWVPWRVPTLNPNQLGSVRDDQAFGNWQHVLPDEIPPEARDEDAVFWQAVRNASVVPADMFARAAEPNRYLTFGHLYGEPVKYRGQIVHLEGRLVRLKRLDPPHHAQLRGIRVLYEAWIYLDQSGTHPICVVTPHKPSDVEIGDGLQRRVSVDGYFFKRYRYISGRLDATGNNVALNTLLLIGSLTPSQPNPAVRGATWRGAPWGPWLAGAGCCMVMVIGGMTWWLRRNDRKVRTRLTSALRGASVCEGFGHN